MQILITGSGGLIGSEAVKYFGNIANKIIGIDNNMRRTLFGSKGSVIWNLEKFQHEITNFINFTNSNFIYR